jgi:hypothetical protein
MVPKTGLEPAHLSAQAPQACVSTNSTTWATNIWWVLTGSNRRPTPCKGAALPTELRTRKTGATWSGWGESNPSSLAWKAKVLPLNYTRIAFDSARIMQAQRSRKQSLQRTGGGGGIRTLDRVTPVPPFQGGDLNRSSTPPNFGRGTRIRTLDPLLPKQVRYQTALHPDDVSSPFRVDLLPIDVLGGG